jgi:excisionase family DNA binding protein
MEKYYTPQEVADILSLDVLTVYRYIKQNKIKTLRVNRQYRIKDSDFKEFLGEKAE